MLDMIIRGGTVVDGTGAPGARADVGDPRRPHRRDRRRSTSRRRAPSTPTGKVVAPGFVDIHTHYDAQVFWDPTLSPSPLHGVTTVIGGNCGFTIAPLGPEHGDYLMRMLARVEGMPLGALAEGVPWDWRTFGEYLDQIDGTLAPNAGFLVGHSTIRRVVMGERATQRRGDARGARRDAALLDAEPRGGRARLLVVVGAHPQRRRRRHGAVALRDARTRSSRCARSCSEYPGTTLEFIPCVGKFEDYAAELMTRDVARGRTVR